MIALSLTGLYSFLAEYAIGACLIIYNQNRFLRRLKWLNLLPILLKFTSSSFRAIFRLFELIKQQIRFKYGMKSYKYGLYSIFIWIVIYLCKPIPKNHSLQSDRDHFRNLCFCQTTTLLKVLSSPSLSKIPLNFRTTILWSDLFCKIRPSMLKVRNTNSEPKIIKALLRAVTSSLPRIKVSISTLSKEQAGITKSYSIVTA